MSGSMYGGIMNLSSMLAPAKELGNVSGLRRLVDALRTENFSMEIVDVVLHHIRYGLPNPRLRYRYERDYPLMSDNVTCAAICAHEAAYLSIHICPPSLGPQMLAKLLEHFDEIMDCLNFLLWYPDPSRKTPQESICNPTKACVAVILLLQHADDAQLIQSRKVIDYAVGAWAVQDWEGYPYISSAQTDTCPTVKLLHSILVFSPECEQSVCDMLGGDSSESKELRKRVVENAILRCDEMAKMERGPSEAQMRRMAMQQHQGLAGKSGNGVVCALQTTFVYLNSVLSVVEYL
ncbi:hypothetical protein FA13DRAFT_1526365 [Coprinellus micaceus]|uniref:Uncharacterized protein n=1 Tax=Coprinellus micaceus TaxID=71717 RepID=A0A4Y7SJC6_COPMI|nr:hypothetical protein FA13DRAFT_1526365 [Coprinellus micaceus]